MQIRTFWALALMLDLAIWAAVIFGIAAMLSGCAPQRDTDWGALSRAVGDQYPKETRQ